jgi:hypothetical protein
MHAISANDTVRKNELFEAEGFLNGLDQAVAIHSFVTLRVWRKLSGYHFRLINCVKRTALLSI